MRAKPSVYSKRNRLPRSLNGIYVGCPSPWGNPFRKGKDGTRAEAIAKFEAYALKRLSEEPEWLDPLVGKDLICWCAPLPCHADVLLRLANDIGRKNDAC